MQNCELAIAQDALKLSPTTDPGLCEEVGSSVNLAEALSKIEAQGWKVETGRLYFKREGLAEYTNAG